MKGNHELETTRHVKNCINFIRRREISRVWDVSLSHYPSQRPRVFLPPYETVFREACNYLSPQSLINFKKISTKSSRFKQSPLMRNIKMPLNTLRKDRSKHWLRGCWVILTVWTRVSFLIATMCPWKMKVSSCHLKLTNKNIMLYVSAAKTRNLIGCL